MRQLDLFQDSPRTIALNVLREAILARNAPGAGIALERLLNLAPGHERASDAGTLIAALEAPAPEGPDEGIERLHALEREWRPVPTLRNVSPVQPSFEATDTIAAHCESCPA